MENERLDLSPLDPARDAAAWSSKIAVLAAKGQSLRVERNRMGPWLLAWGRPSVALAATMALILWLATPHRAPESSTNTVDPTLAVAAWAVSDTVPSTTEFLETLGAIHHVP